MRHLVLEGPDGGGKTRLAQALLAQWPHLLMGKKASTSLKGPIKNLAAWTIHEFDVMEASSGVIVYDRHPVISEPIYGPIARDSAQPGFSPSPWLSSARLKMYKLTYVIWCIPPLEQVQKAVAADRDMPGVTDNIEAIHKAYRNAWLEWGGPGIRYNFADTLSDDERANGADVLDNGLFAGAVRFVEEFAAMAKSERILDV